MSRMTGVRYFERDAARLERGVEAVARAIGGDDRQRRLAVAAVHRQQQVGLLGLGGQAGRRAAALDVDDDSGSSRLTARPIASDLRSTPGPLVVVTPRWPANAAPIAAPIAGDLVLGLQRAHAEVLVLRQLVEDVGRRRDRVRRRGTSGSLACWPAAISPYASAMLPVMLRYVPGASVRRRDLVRVVEQLGGLAEVVAGLERGAVGRRAPCGSLANRFSIHSSVGSIGRVYIHEISPRAKKFFERSASRGFTPSSLVASSVSDVIGTS